MPRRLRRPRQQQRARCVLVEPVDKLGPPVSSYSSASSKPSTWLSVLVPPCVARPAGLLMHAAPTRPYGSPDFARTPYPRRVSAVCAMAARPPRPRRSAGGTRICLADRDPVTWLRVLPSSRNCPVRAQRDTMLKLASGRLPLKPAVEPDAVVVLGNLEDARIGHWGACSKQSSSLRAKLVGRGTIERQNSMVEG